jgi:hypothetical protein
MRYKLIAGEIGTAIDRLGCKHDTELIEHDLFGKPVSTFPDHAPGEETQ